MTQSKKIGRPSVPDAQKLKPICIRLSQEEIEFLSSREISMAKFVRQIVDKEMKKVKANDRK